MTGILHDYASQIGHKNRSLDKIPLPRSDSKSVQVDYYRVAPVVPENIPYISITMNHAWRVQSPVDCTFRAGP
jgi:hypothetical protein